MRKLPTLARLLSAAALLALPLVGWAQSTTITISQVYPGGGSGAAGTTYTRDYVELFNRSASAVAIGGWSLQYASAAGTTVSGNLAIPAGVTVPAGGYYLIVTGSAGAAGVAVPNGDLVSSTSGTPSLAAAGGKVFIVNNATTATFGTGANFGGSLSANVVDAVGYGTGNAYEGGTVAPAPASNAALIVRAGSGCTDTNVNGADFANGTTAANPPRNSTTTAAPCSAPSAPEINVKQGATSYAVGSTYSGFAATTIGSNDAKTFTVENTGTAVLNVSSIALSGANASEFALSALSPASPVAASGSATFNVTFTPSGTGTRTATLTITNDDSDEGSYTITLNGTGQASTPNPEINVQQAGTNYLTGSTYAGFASTPQGNTAAAVTFTVQNTSSTDALTVSSIAVSGTNASDFTVSALNPASPVAASGSATFNITFAPGGTGARTALLTITNNDQDEGTYTITLNATATAPAPTATNYSATSLLAGIQSNEVVTGTNLTGATVSVTGSTAGTVVVGTPTVSATSVTVTLLAPSAGSFTLNVTTPGGTLTQAITVTTPPTGFFEPFETASRSANYATPNPLSLTTGQWNLTEALLGNQAPSATPGSGEKKNNGQSVRFRTAGVAEMAFDKGNGAGTISFVAALYGNDVVQASPASSILVEISTNGGGAYTTVGTTPTLTSTLTTYSFMPNVGGNIRLRFTSNTTGTVPRINMDDLLVTDFASVAGDLTVNTTGQNISGTYNNVTITGTGSATVTGPLTVNNAMTVQSGGSLTTGSQVITGAGTFTLASGATLSISNTAGITSSGASGPVQSTGTRSFSTDASYIYNGTAPQVTGSGLPATVRTLTLNNTASPVANRTVTLSQALSVAQLVRLTSGSLTTGGNGFTLLSVRGQGTALVYNEGTGTIVGAGTMQRAVDATTNDNIGYHHYSSPVVSTTINDLQTPGFDFVLNPAFNTATLTGQTRPYPTVLGYDEARLATSPATDLGAFDKGFFSPASGDAMVVGRGYTASVPNALTVDFNGTFNTGNIAAGGTLTRGAAVGSPDQAGWQLLGNPYPSPLDWGTVSGAQRVNLDASAYVYHATGRYTGFYTTYLGTLVTNGVNGQTTPIIDAGSGFFARVSAAGTGALNLTNANRVTSYGNQASFGRSNSTRPALRLQLSGAGLSDEATLYFAAQATAGLDASYDATKLTNPNGLNLATLAGTQQLTIDGRPALTAATVVPLFVGVPALGSYTLTAASLANFGSTAVYLRDALTGSRTRLVAGTAYRFTLAGYTAPGRFTLEFAPAGTALATAAQALAAQVQLYPNPAAGRFQVVLPAGGKAMSATLSNVLGQVVLTRTLSSNEADFAVATPGLYTLRLTVDGTTITRKVVVE